MTKLNLSHDKYAARLQNAQISWITRKFGSKYAAGANYGWVHNGSGLSSELTTKIYTKGYLNSFYDDGEIVHEFEMFDEDDKAEDTHQGIFLANKPSWTKSKTTWW